ncbi:MAG: hypothetical protein EXS36_10810 [Pedosphaera sp.]|nr:hypothetical protein [Pedosphaera sp.]
MWVSWVAGAMLSTSAFAADSKGYQVTGPVSAVTDTAITAQKDDQKWELARSKQTKGAAKIKVGDKVTVYYRMIADEVEIKEAPKPAPSADSKKK